MFMTKTLEDYTFGFVNHSFLLPLACPCKLMYPLTPCKATYGELSI